MKKTFYAIVMAVAALGFTACSGSSSENKTADAEQTEETTVAQPEEAAPAEDVVTLTDDNLFRPDKAPEVLTVLDFNATWCVPCKKLTPAYHEAAAKLGDKVKFYSVDIEKNPATKEAFEVQNVPTVVILAPNGEVETFVGLGPFVGEAGAEGDLTPVILKSLMEKINKYLN
ncbi:MAG: thioredoxin family protein [Muribaculaceae bacterium]|nr:thioredoxin family protein [Muribaculaceae bacterium]